MANAKEEFLRHVGNKEVLCASIDYQDCWQENKTKYFKLHFGYTLEEYNSFIELLGFIYDDGYGGQELYGTIWYKNGTWSDRGEYDGSEWWNFHECPKIPESLYHEE